jgi:purine catabolism regulator
MSLTIREGLKFGGLFGSTVVAGDKGLDRPIESISVLEVAEENISRWVVQNQLYITSFYAIWDNIDQQKRVIRTLIDSGCCGLVLCYVGMWMQEIDPDIIALCNQADFPLIQARTNVSYTEILNPVINLLYEENTQVAAPKDYSTIRNDFLALIINEENTDEVFRQMNERLQRKISYYDVYGKKIFSDRTSDEIHEEEEYLKDNFEHVLYACSKRGYMRESIFGKDKWIALIRSQKNLFGLFITDYQKEEGKGLESHFLDPLIVSSALLLRRRDRITDFEEKALQEYVADLLVWNFPSNETALSRGREIGLSIEDKNYVILININSIQRIISPETQQDMQTYIKRVLLARIESFLKSYDPKNWLAFRSDTIILFLSNSSHDINLTEFGHRLLAFFEAKYNLSVSIGVSNYFREFTELPDGYYQAFQAATVGREHYGENKVISYNQVWFFQKLRQMGEHRETRAVSRWLLRPVVRYDHEHSTELTETLYHLLWNNGSVQKTAQQMYVHKNTMLQRKNKIIELFGYSPFEMPYLLNFLMIFDILQSNELPFK